MSQEILRQDEEPVATVRAKSRSDVFDKQFQKIRQDGYSCIEHYPMVDSHFSEYIHNLLDLNGTNFEAVKLKEYILQCRKEYSEILEEGIVAFDGADLPASPSNYQSFICAISQYILNKYGKQNQSTNQESSVMLDQIYVSFVLHLLRKAQRNFQDIVYTEVKKVQRHATNKKPNMYLNIFNKKSKSSIRKTSLHQGNS